MSSTSTDTTSPTSSDTTSTSILLTDTTTSTLTDTTTPATDAITSTITDTTTSSATDVIAPTFIDTATPPLTDTNSQTFSDAGIITPPPTHAVTSGPSVAPTLTVIQISSVAPTLSDDTPATPPPLLSNSLVFKSSSSIAELTPPHVIPGLPPTQSSIQVHPPTNTLQVSPSSRSSPAPLIGGIVGGVIFGILLASFIGLYMSRRRKRDMISPFVDPSIRSRNGDFPNFIPSIFVQQNASPQSVFYGNFQDVVENSTEIAAIPEDGRTSREQDVHDVGNDSIERPGIQSGSQDENVSHITHIVELPPLYAVQ